MNVETFYGKSTTELLYGDPRTATEIDRLNRKAASAYSEDPAEWPKEIQGYWIDEAGDINMDAWENLQADQMNYGVSFQNAQTGERIDPTKVYRERLGYATEAEWGPEPEITASYLMNDPYYDLHKDTWNFFVEVEGSASSLLLRHSSIAIQELKAKLMEQAEEAIDGQIQAYVEMQQRPSKLPSEHIQDALGCGLTPFKVWNSRLPDYQMKAITAVPQDAPWDADCIPDPGYKYSTKSVPQAASTANGHAVVGSSSTAGWSAKDALAEKAKQYEEFLKAQKSPYGNIWAGQQAIPTGPAVEPTQGQPAETEEKPIGSAKYKPLDIPRFD